MLFKEEEWKAGNRGQDHTSHVVFSSDSTWDRSLQNPQAVLLQGEGGSDIQEVTDQQGWWQPAAAFASCLVLLSSTAAFSVCCRCL